MPAFLSWLVPSVLSGLGLIGSHKASKSAQLDPETKRLQQQALQLQNQRMLLMNPLLEQLVRGGTGRLAASSQPGTFQLPNLNQLRSPGTAQAVTRLSRRVRPPEQG